MILASIKTTGHSFQASICNQSPIHWPSFCGWWWQEGQLWLEMIFVHSAVENAYTCYIKKGNVSQPI
jgi:hypothetical protein